MTTFLLTNTTKHEADCRAGKWIRSLRAVAAAIVMLFFVFLADFVHAQMPDWILINDRDGNRYWMDPNGKIYCSGEPEAAYRPVSSGSIDYSYNQGVSLIKNHYKIEGLLILKSLMALSADSGRIIDVQRKASMEINALIRREGDRYEALNAQASILMFRERDAVTLVNDRMRYSLRCNGNIAVVKRTSRRHSKYEYQGLLLGVNFTSAAGMARNEARGYDALIAVDAERFARPFMVIGELERNWKNNLGADSFDRTLVENSDSSKIYGFEDASTPGYSGFEGLYINGVRGYCARIITTKDVMKKCRDEILGLLKGIRIY